MAGGSVEVCLHCVPFACVFRVGRVVRVDKHRSLVALRLAFPVGKELPVA